MNDFDRARRALRDGGMFLLTSKLLRRLSNLLLVRAAARVVQTRGVAQNLDEDIAFVMSFQLNGLTIAPLQVPNEIGRLLEALAPDPPGTVLEIGTSKGGTLFLFTRVARPDALIIAIDLPTLEQPRYGGGDYALRAPLYRAFARERQRIVFLPADSHAPRTRERVARELGGRTIDFLFIDGDHTAEGVRSDFEMYSSFVRSGGVIAVHDIVDGPEENVGGVPEFWREVRGTNSLEFVEDWEQGGYGIGVLRNP